jgi:hypothetical protein
MSHKSLEIITVQNGKLVIHPYTDLEVQWEHVSNDFYLSFMSYYQQANEILQSSLDKNVGLNTLCMLEKVIEKINQKQVSKKDSFEKIYQQVVQETLMELNIA